MQSEAEYPFPQEEIERLKRRSWVLNQVPEGTKGAEVGVFRGHFSEIILKKVRPKKLYLVDIWTKGGEYFGWSSPYTNFNTLPTRVALEEVREKVKRYETDVEIIEEYSNTFFQNLKDELDWIYLDTSHKYENTLKELKNADRIIKPGGLILGDDWHASPNHKSYGVVLAVNTFVKDTDYILVSAGAGNQFCIRKPL